VVVGWGTAASGTEAFRWQGGATTGLGPEKVAVLWDDQGTHGVEDLLVQQLGLDLTGVDLRSVLGISSNGRTIAGEGTYQPPNAAARRIAWMAAIPEPATVSLAAIGLIVLSSRRRRR
jgi:PEP-CTERM motif-containing protein